MKKLVIFFIIVVAIVSGMSYWYLNDQNNRREAQKENLSFETFLNQEVYGADLSSVINRAMDSNQKNQVSKDKKGIYHNNDTNSISIEIKMIDNDKIYPMELIAKGGVEQFMMYYNKIVFKCTKLTYHETTKKVNYMLFEQITD